MINTLFLVRRLSKSNIQLHDQNKVFFLHKNQFTFFLASYLFCLDTFSIVDNFGKYDKIMFWYFLTAQYARLNQHVFKQKHFPQQSVPTSNDMVFTFYHDSIQTNFQAYTPAEFYISQGECPYRLVLLQRI